MADDTPAAPNVTTSRPAMSNEQPCPHAGGGSPGTTAIHDRRGGGRPDGQGIYDHVGGCTTIDPPEPTAPTWSVDSPNKRPSSLASAARSDFYDRDS